MSHCISIGRIVPQRLLRTSTLAPGLHRLVRSALRKFWTYCAEAFIERHTAAVYLHPCFYTQGFITRERPDASCRMEQGRPDATYFWRMFFASFFFGRPMRRAE
jgi:hypothetical protein